MDLSLTCVIATQLWHHIYLGGGLCELPTWESATSYRREDSPNLDRPVVPSRQTSHPASARAR